jgi:hypothetical protein
MVTVQLKPKPTATAAFRTLIDENAQVSREREPGYVACASPCSYSWADDRILLCKIHDGCAAFSLAIAAFAHSTRPAPTGHEQQRYQA